MSIRMSIFLIFALSFLAAELMSKKLAYIEWYTLRDCCIGCDENCIDPGAVCNCIRLVSKHFKKIF